MREMLDTAREMLRDFRGEKYVFGTECFATLGRLTGIFGRRAAVVASGFGKPWGAGLHAAILDSLENAGVRPVGEIVRGAGLNTPEEDVRRVAGEIAGRAPEVIVAVGGGSVIDGAKASNAFAALCDRRPALDDYFGTGRVTEFAASDGARLLPLVAGQLAASSASHLTRYACATDIALAQKRLIVDDALIPSCALFDYSMTRSMSPAFTADGGMDGIAHALEVFFGLDGAKLETVWPVATLAIELIVANLKRACDDPDDLAAREALGLGTDLGGYAIMIGGTNGAHLASYTLVDILSHGRACALMNPYYTVFFAPAIELKLKAIGRIFKNAGFIPIDIERLAARALGEAVADGMRTFAQSIGFPTRLSEVAGFTDGHIARALQAAKNPQLEMKLRNMPVPLSAATVDEYMGPIFEAAKTGDFSAIKNFA